MIGQPWKRRCPEGHHNWRANTQKRVQIHGPYYCHTCEEFFDELEPAPQPDQPAWKGEVVLK